MIVSCSQSDKKFEPADPSGLIVQKFGIGDDNFEILLPQEYTPQRTTESKVMFIIPDKRNVHYLSISKDSPISTQKKTPLQKWKYSVPIREGSDFQFSLKQNIGGGSGGTEGELTGIVRLDQTVLDIECHDQSEWQPEPEWCVPYIHHLRFSSNRSASLRKRQTQT